MVVLNEKKEKSFLSYLIVILVFLAMLNNIPIVGLSQVGLVSILVIFIVTVFSLTAHLMKTNTLSRFHVWLVILGFCYTVLNLFGYFQDHGIRYYVVTFQFFFLFIFFLTLTFVKWDINKLRFLSKISALIIVLNFTLLTLQKFPTHFSGLFNNPNSLGLFIFLVYFFYTVQGVKKRKILWFTLTTMSMTLIYFSSARSIFLSIAVMLITYVGWNFITKNRLIFTSFIAAVIAALISFVYIYPNMYKWKSFQSLNNLTWEYTGKNLLSGREVIWEKTLSLLQEKIWFGFGAGATPSIVQGVELSAHNLYVQVAYQLGLIGLAILMLILLTIWFGFWKGRNDNKVRLSAAFFIGTLIQQSFEVTLIQNNMAIALMQWLIIGIGIGLSFRYSRKTKIESSQSDQTA